MIRSKICFLMMILPSFPILDIIHYLIGQEIQFFMKKQEKVKFYIKFPVSKIYTPMELRSFMSGESLIGDDISNQNYLKTDKPYKSTESQDNIYQLNIYNSLVGDDWIILKHTLTMCHNFERDLKQDARKICNLGSHPNPSISQLASYSIYQDLEDLRYDYSKTEHLPYDIPEGAKKFLLMRGYDRSEFNMSLPSFNF